MRRPRPPQPQNKLPLRYPAALLAALLVALIWLILGAHDGRAAEAEERERPPSEEVAPVDLGSPRTSFFTSPPGPDGDDGWFRSPVIITLTASDSEGSPVTTYYGWDVDAPASLYAGSFALPTGTRTLYYRSVDAAGNEEPVRSQVFMLDAAVTAPRFLAPGGTEESPALVRGSIRLEASADDSGSGVAYVNFFRFAPRDGGWDPVGSQIGPNQTSPVTGPNFQVAWDTFTVGDGLHRLQAQVRDRAGNTAFSEEQYVLVDNTSPSVQIQAPSASARLSGTRVSINGEVADANLAGWALELRQLPQGEWTRLAGEEAEAAGSLASLDSTRYSDGEYELRLRASDAAGNQTEVTHSSLVIDNTPPSLLSARSGGPESVDVVFDEPLDPESVVADHFAIGGLQVTAAALQLDGRTVTLTSAPQTDGRSYTLRVGGRPPTVTDAAGNGVVAGALGFRGSTTDTTPPRPPQSVQVTAGNSRNEVSWSGGLEPDLAGYHLYRARGSADRFAERVNEEVVTGTNSFADQEYGESGIFRYVVTAVDQAGNQSAPSPPVSADVVRMSVPLGAEGGELASSTGEFRLAVPSGALAQEQTIQVTEQPRPGDEPGFTFVSAAYELEPDGLAFNADVSLSLAVDMEQAAAQEGGVRLVYFSEDGWRQVEGGSSFDETSGTVTGEVNHFTRFAAALVDSTPPSLESVDPSAGAQERPVTSNVTLVFNEPMDPATLTLDNLLVTDAGQPINLEPPVFSGDLRTVYLYPAEMLEVSKTYSVLVRGGAVRDVAGNGLVGDLSSSFTTAAAGVGPHDAYLSAEELCATCHDVQGGREPDRQTLPAEKRVCYTCHDGTGSAYNVRTADHDSTPSSDFGEEVLGASGKSSYHPVPQATRRGTGVTMLCSNCHNAHPRPGEGPRMLVVKKLEVGFTGRFAPRTGNDFCWTCHEATAEGSSGYISSAAWNASTGFDHKGFYPSPGTSHNSLAGVGFSPESASVPSLEGVACKACHSEHGSANGKLVAERVNGTEISFSTENDSAYNATYNGLCAACHEAPGVGGFSWPGSGTYSLSGHGASTAAKALNYAPPVPAASQTLQTGVCKQCHEPHGAGDDNGPFANLTRYFEEGVCFACHGGANNPQGARNLQAAFLREYRHDLDMSTSGGRKHDLEGEQAGALNPNPGLAGADRHVECTDCHNTHYATGSAQGDNALHARGSNEVSGALLGVWGVEPDPGEAWSSSSEWDWAGSRVFPASREYQICLKCHSAAAYGSSPPARPQQLNPGDSFWNSDSYTDQASEFNPANASYHAVWGNSKASGFGAYRNGWTSNSRMYCSDCHRSSSPGDPAGPHGSSTPFLLGGNTSPGASRYVKGVTASYVSTEERDADFSFCYECHDPGFANTGFSTPEGLNLHTARHETDSCTSCHAAVPHGGRREHLLITRSDPPPYNDHGPDFGIPDSAVFSPSGEWTEGSCHNEENTGCHSL